ncbi:MAG: nodulation protein NfeD [Bacteriovoracaceae bacterium]|nr:nodulation protein NfeD [Bacteriovoracaceae bacterium]
MKTSLFNLILLLSLSFSTAFGQDVKPAEYAVKRIKVLEISASINPATYSYLATEIGKAKSTFGDMVVIRMNTPGGLVTTTKDIITLIGKSDVPVAIWVSPEGASATSAGAIIAASAHLLTMSEGTNIGAATPIGMGKDIDQKDARAKAVNDLVALVSSLSESRGRNPKAFSKMISEAASYGAKEALEKGIVDAIINSQVDLLEFINGQIVRIKGKDFKLDVKQGAAIVEADMDPGQKILDIFSNPMTAYILFMIGAALVYFEFQAPGGFIAGGVGVVFLILAGIGFQVLPLNFGALGLVILSFILFILEIYITSYGILAIAGTAALIFGSLFLFRTENAYMDIQLPLVLSVAGAILLYIFLVGYVLFAGKVKRKDRKRWFTAKNEFAHISKYIRQEDGSHYYQVKVAGEIWNARSNALYEINEKVKVLEQDNDKMILILE